MRLIDADALKKEFPKDTDWEYPVNTNSYVCEMIDSQPTIKPDRSLWFRIGETCVDESKGFISAERAVEKIRELLREER